LNSRRSARRSLESHPGNPLLTASSHRRGQCRQSTPRRECRVQNPRCSTKLKCLQAGQFSAGSASASQLRPRCDLGARVGRRLDELHRDRGRPGRGQTAISVGAGGAKLVRRSVTLPLHSKLRDSSKNTDAWGGSICRIARLSPRRAYRQGRTRPGAPGVFPTSTTRSAASASGIL